MSKQEENDFLLGDWWVSPSQGSLTRGDEVLHLEPKTMEVLAYFAARPGQVVTREALEQDVWRGALIGYDSITATVLKLRKALKDDAREPRFIATIPKKGYRLIASVSQDDHQTAGYDSVVQAPIQHHLGRVGSV